MNNTTVTALAWLALALHVVVGGVTLRRPGGPPLVPLVNLATGLCVLAYWAQKWYGYLTRGITWYLTDQLVPLYAVLVVVLAGLTLAGRTSGSLPHWLVFGIDAVVLLAAALFFTFFRMSRLI